MHIGLIVLVSIMLYQTICFIILVISPFFNINTEKISLLLCCSIYMLPIMFIKNISELFKRNFKVSIVQRNRECFRGFDYIPVLCKYEDIKYFENNDEWHVYIKNPTRKIIKDGYSETIGGVIHNYNFSMISDKELNKIKEKYTIK